MTEQITPPPMNAKEAKAQAKAAQAYAKAQHNPAVDAQLNRCREVSGAEVLLTRQGDRTGAVTVLKALRTGGAVGLLADQRPRTSEGEAATFLGVPTWCHPGPAFFAQRAKVWLVPAFALRVRSDLTKVYVMENPQPYACAKGRDPEHAAVDATTGLLSSLSLDEIECVMAH